MLTVLLAIHIIVAIVMVGFILIQHGKGADAGASFGSGAAGTVFGAAGSANFLTRTTAVLAAIFFMTSLALAHFAQKQAEDQLRLDVPVATSQAPAEPSN
ncbi:MULTISPECIES: preprotein translocase subunit SecG [Moraxella]|uniref:preprotein translocase subunit SecG n=1 Tax=Moraxella TaxID=475 RepID=UPI000C9ECD10|nr:MULTISPECIES: preprotein translocase subunit SecG [Moraxella]MDH2273812.1 preprotein translocase subunit SecG [Moraxella porci]PNP97013.1 preprotein translocase subunit SecG [Moraxella sp. RCAD0137]